MKNDPINPNHYKQSPSGVEAIDVIEHMTLNVGNAMKYLWRAGLKDEGNREKQIEDLKKAAWYVNREIERLSGSRQVQEKKPAPVAPSLFLAGTSLDPNPKDSPQQAAAKKAILKLRQMDTAQFADLFGSKGSASRSDIEQAIANLHEDGMDLTGAPGEIFKIGMRVVLRDGRRGTIRGTACSEQHGFRVGVAVDEDEASRRWYSASELAIDASPVPVRPEEARALEHADVPTESFKTQAYGA